MWSALTDRQREVAGLVLDEESQRREHIVVHVSGAHAYGFASPDSDVDLKAIHIEPTHALLRLEPPAATIDRLEVIDGVEIDYTSNELLTAVRGLVSGNGNMLERLASHDPARSSALLPELAVLARHTLSRRYHRHYRGFAKSQRDALAESPTAKKALYVLRTTLTGTHLLETGECVPDLTALYDRYGFGIAAELLVLKRSAEKQRLPDALQIELPTVLDEAFARLDAAHAHSILPEEPDVARAEQVLLDIRGRAHPNRA
jgi:predicted nucleotidyltransferase